MSGRGDIPGTEGGQTAEDRAYAVSLGATVYDADGEALGTIRGLEEGGFP